MCQFAACAELSGICARIKAIPRRLQMRQNVKSAKDDQKSADVVRKAEAGRFVPKRMALTLRCPKMRGSRGRSNLLRCLEGFEGW